MASPAAIGRIRLARYVHIDSSPTAIEKRSPAGVQLPISACVLDIAKQEHGAHDGRERPRATRQVEHCPDDEVGGGNRRDAPDDERANERRNVLFGCWTAMRFRSADPGGKKTGTPKN